MEQALMNTIERDTIVAISTAPGVGGIAVIRLSGDDAIKIVEKCWRGADLNKIVSHTAHLGKIIDHAGEVFDEVVLTYFKGPQSFTGEDVMEISCHGSRWIQREIVNLLIESGARPAGPGEFTQRAFMNGRLDLAQAEGVIDLISSSSRAAHRLARQQTSGRFSGYLNSLREQLIDLASLLELELDFSEEDVEFADRSKLRQITDDTLSTLRKLAKSYATGKVLKDGISVVIAGAPNAGKSTLLNTLLDDEKAIVSDIPGTTRDVIEDTAEIDGVLFRFADTAGLRNTTDEIERIGIRRAEERLRKACIVLWLVDVTNPSNLDEIEAAKVHINALPDAKHILLLNKTDLSTKKSRDAINRVRCEQSEDPAIECATCSQVATISGTFDAIIPISAAKGDGIDPLKEMMVKLGYGDYNPESDVMLTNSRHYAAILAGITALERVATALTPPVSAAGLSLGETPSSAAGLSLGETLSGAADLSQGDYAYLSADLIAQDVREALHHLSELTGNISTPDLLTTIFSRFCIGK